MKLTSLQPFYGKLHVTKCSQILQYEIGTFFTSLLYLQQFHGKIDVTKCSQILQCEIGTFFTREQLFVFLISSNKFVHLDSSQFYAPTWIWSHFEKVLGSVMSVDVVTVGKSTNPQ